MIRHWVYRLAWELRKSGRMDRRQFERVCVWLDRWAGMTKVRRP